MGKKKINYMLLGASIGGIHTGLVSFFDFNIAAKLAEWTSFAGLEQITYGAVAIFGILAFVMAFME